MERYSFAAQHLVQAYPPRLEHPNKLAVYAISCPPGSVHGGDIGYTRWPAITLPNQVNLLKAATLLTISPGFYDYIPVSADPLAVEWHVNFADPQLFGFYGTGLFAQDEMQVAEHPALGSLIDAVRANGGEPITENRDGSTPVLVTGVERRAVVSTNPDAVEGRPYGLYGNNFSRANTDVVRRATNAITPVSISNIVAMSAPGMGSGRYLVHQIENILTVATTGFTAAVLESERLHGEAAKTIIHTGFWGCGAFGGNRLLMVMLQAIAAQMAGVGEIVIHAADSAGNDDVERSITMMRDLGESSNTLGTSSVIDGIESLGFEWGFSDGN